MSDLYENFFGFTKSAEVDCHFPINQEIGRIES